MSDKKGTEVDGKEIDDLMMEDEEITETADSEKDDLAQEALDATEEPTEDAVDAEETEVEETDDEEVQVDPKDAKIGEFRRKNRDLEIANAKLEGELEARKDLSKPVAEVVKSPLELAEEAYIEEYGELPAEGVPMTSKLYSEQLKFDAEQSSKPAASPENGGLDVAIDLLQNGKLSVEKMGKGRDFESVLSQADEVLTRGDVVDIKDFTAKHGKVKGLEESYRKTVVRLKQSGQWTEEPKVKAKPKVAQKTERKLNSNDVDDMMSAEDDINSTDSESSDLNKLANVLGSIVP